MDVDFIAVLDRIEDFKLSTATHEKWESWLRQFNIVLRARAFDNLPNSRRVALLLTKCKGFIDVLNVLNINEETVEYDELVSQLTQYLKPINARHAFLNRTQGDDESFNNYAEALVSLSHPCRFLDPKVVRDVYVANLNVKHDKVKKLILSKVDPSLEDALALSNAMVFQGCVESTHQQDIDYSPNMPLNNEFVPTKYNVRMMPCTSGVHEVHVINIANGMVFVCPKPMVHSRTKILNEFNNDMRNCNESQVMPNKVHIGGLYAALVNAKWYRVRVLAEQQKKVDIVSIDFGWMKTIPFSVLRNLPLDYRVINELVWSLMWYNDSIPDSLQANQTTVIKVFQCNNVWQADLPRERRSLSPSAMTSDFRNVRISRQTTDGGIPQRRSLGQEKPTSYENTRGNRGSYRKSSSDTTSCDTDRESVKGAELSNGHARESKQSGRSSRQQCFQQPKQNYDSDSMEDSNCYQKSQRVTQKIRPEGSSKAHFIPHSVEMNGAASSLSRNGQLANDRLKVVSLGCPIPLNRYTKVEVSYKSNKGVLYCYRVDCKDKLMALSAELYNLQESGLPSITNPQKGDLCLAFDDGCLLRAKIVSIHTSTQRAKLSFIDSGHYEKKPISELQELPEKFQDVPGFVFPIQVNTEAQIEQYEEIEVKPVRQNEDGSWVMEVNNSHVKPKAGSQSNPSSTQIAERRSPLEDVPRQSTNQQGGVKQALKPSADKTRVADPPRRPRPPPIPRSQFSEVMVVWDGPEGTFALDATKTKTLLDVQDALNTCDLRRLSGPAEVDGLYVAPFEGENFRARVIEFTKNKKSCLVTFVDYGNEGELPIEDLRCLPDQIRDVPVYTFKFQFAMADSKPQVEEIYEVTPVVLQADGSWLVQLKGEPTSSEFALPDDEDIGPFQR